MPSPIAAPPPPAAVSEAGTRRLIGVVGRVRGRWSRLIAGEGALSTLGVFVVLLAVGLLLDWKWEWPRVGRAVWAGFVLAVTLGTWIRKWWLPRRGLPGSDAMALMLEARRPDLRSRLISALQLSGVRWDDPEAEFFVSRLRAEAEDITETLDLSAVFPADRLRRMAARVLPAVLAVLTGLAWGWPTSGILLRRALLEEVEVPRRTRIVEASGALTVGRGDDVMLWARAEGVLPSAGQVWVRHESGREQRTTLEAETGQAGRYVRTLANVTGSFSYRLRVNDAEEVERRVEVLPRPVVTNLVLTQVLPAYTGLASRRLAPGELSLLRGSRLRIEGRASQSLRGASIRLGGLDQAAGAKVDGTGFESEIVVRDSGWNAFAVDLEDDRGIRSKDPAIYAVEVLSDQGPQVRMLLPTRREELVTARGTVLMSFEAKDDFGLGALRIRHQPAGATNATPGTIDLDLDGEKTPTARRRFDWRLSTLIPPLTEGALYEFWVEALDRNDVDGPGIGRSDRFLLRVVSEAEKRADLLSRAGDAIGRLGDVAEGQERLNESLGRIILAKPVTP